jgi:arsenate reductase-like glutaredoxin family protein
MPNQNEIFEDLQQKIMEGVKLSLEQKKEKKTRVVSEEVKQKRIETLKYAREKKAEKSRLLKEQPQMDEVVTVEQPAEDNEIFNRYKLLEDRFNDLSQKFEMQISKVPRDEKVVEQPPEIKKVVEQPSPIPKPVVKPAQVIRVSSLGRNPWA